jgi:multiple sugar transport system permease protein
MIDASLSQDSTSSEQYKNVVARFSDWLEKSARNVLLMPAILLVLLLSIFPLIVSLYLSFARLSFVRGGFETRFVGLNNFAKLLVGSEQSHFLGRLAPLQPIGWGILICIVGLLAFALFPRSAAAWRNIFGLVMRIVGVVLGGGLAWVVISALSTGGQPGTLVVTIIYVFVGVTFQYLIGLGLALLVTQNLPGKRFFRVIFLLPMMITPVGISFLVRMMADTLKGPIAPIWNWLGLTNFSWADTSYSARNVVLLGDIWQWTPFMFIILLAALEATSRDQIEAALVDGANRVEMFRYIILPQIIPVSTTVILIRMIEAFKIIDIPNILTGGGPGTATESMTLHAYYAGWRGTDLGAAAAIAYLLLAVVTLIAVIYVNTVRQRFVERD